MMEDWIAAEELKGECERKEVTRNVSFLKLGDVQTERKRDFLRSNVGGRRRKKKKKGEVCV